MRNQVFIPQRTPLLEIELVSVRFHCPTYWAYRKGIRVFFDHVGETILDQFAYRNNRPVGEYIRLIRSSISDEIKLHERFDGDRKIRRVHAQQPYMGSMTDQWFPRDAFVVAPPTQKSRVRSPYNHSLDYEILATVRNL
jgi:hypothetical protein